MRAVEESIGCAACPTVFLVRENPPLSKGLYRRVAAAAGYE